MYSSQKIRAMIMTFWAIIGLILFTAYSQSASACQHINYHSNTPRVVLYTTSWCPYCHKALQFFNDHQISYTNCDVEKSQEAYQQFHQLGGGPVPLIMVGNYRIEGFDQAGIERALSEHH